jgi:hypothetical protein
MRRIRSFLLSPDPSGGGGSPGNESPNAPVVPANTPPVQTPADPAAARTVIEGTKTERELALEQQLEAEKNARKKDQTRVSELENQNHELKQIPEDKKKKPRDVMNEFFGWED